VAAAVVGIGLLVVGRPVGHVALAWLRNGPAPEPPPPTVIVDASGLDPIDVAEVIAVGPGVGEGAAQVRAALDRARAAGKHLSVAGARHSMGGHVATPDGLVLDLDGLDHVVYDPATTEVTVGAGARWSEVVPALDAVGRSVAVMQSNNSFSVGGTVSVNAHGWQARRPPVVDTIRRMRVVTPDGELRDVGPADPLFGLIVGGYGMFGVILEVTLETVPNRLYRMHTAEVPLDALAATFASAADDPEVEMLFGRMDIRPDHRFETGLVNRLIPLPREPGPLDEPKLQEAVRAVLMGSVDSDYGKDVRWGVEQLVVRAATVRPITRNTLLNAPVTGIEDHRPDHAQILHEYFVPPDQVAAFLQAVDAIVTEEGADLLNVTVRDVRADTVTLLSYAPGPRLAFVMLFDQHGADGEAAMARLTGRLIDSALGHGGAYYLPYRRHASQSQLEAAYPNFPRFAEEKGRWDPDGVLSNRWWQTYGPR
jgi:FAD/FMN-containing dehydrogenase